MFLDNNELLIKTFSQQHKISCQEEEIDIYSPLVTICFFLSFQLNEMTSFYAWASAGYNYLINI